MRERRSGLGGTDAASILGVSRYANEFDVWLEKVGEAPPRQDNERMWWGRMLEPVVAHRYEIETGRKLWNPEQIVRDPDDDVLIGTPDRLVVGEKVGIDIKTTGIDRAHEWGDPGTDQIPAEYVVQCCHYMMVTRFPVWDVAVLIGGNDFRIYRVKRDVELESMMRPRLVEWWRRHVVERSEPAMGASRSARDWLQRRFPKPTGVILKATTEADRLAGHLSAARDAQTIADDARAEAENLFRVTIGEAAGIDGDDWRVRWTAVKGREITDIDKMIGLTTMHLVGLIGGDDPDQARRKAEAIVAEILNGSRVRSEGTRRFLFTTRGKA